MKDSYRVVLPVSVEDREKLLSAARSASLVNGFGSVEEYDRARAQDDDPVMYDLMEILQIVGLDISNGVVAGDLDIEEFGL